VTKPFSVLELMARIKTVLRRAAPESRDAGILHIGDLVVDFGKHAAEKAATPSISRRASSRSSSTSASAG